MKTDLSSAATSAVIMYGLAFVISMLVALLIKGLHSFLRRLNSK